VRRRDLRGVMAGNGHPYRDVYEKQVCAKAA